jgi:hypothetical protein
MRIYLQLAALLLVLIAMTYRTCHRTNVEPFNVGHNIDSLLTQTEVLRERARIAESRSREIHPASKVYSFNCTCGMRYVYSVSRCRV